jgi:hypothetical protein
LVYITLNIVHSKSIPQCKHDSKPITCIINVNCVLTVKKTMYTWECPSEDSRNLEFVSKPRYCHTLWSNHSYYGASDRFCFTLYICYKFSDFYLGEFLKIAKIGQNYIPAKKNGYTVFSGAFWCLFFMLFLFLFFLVIIIVLWNVCVLCNELFIVRDEFFLCLSFVCRIIYRTIRPIPGAIITQYIRQYLCV